MLKATISANVCMSPQKEFFPLMLWFSRRTLLWRVSLFPRNSLGFWTFLNVKLLPPRLGCIRIEQHTHFFSRERVMHSLPHKPWSRADNEVARWPLAKCWSWAKAMLFPAQLWLPLDRQCPSLTKDLQTSWRRVYWVYFILPVRWTSRSSLLVSHSVLSDSLPPHGL